MKTVVLLSSFNGERYISTQIMSILNQDYEGDLRVIVRDDGSVDDTLHVIRDIYDDRLEIIEGENIGAKASYFRLIEIGKEQDFDFIAFADQDDIWRKDKLRTAVRSLLNVKGAGLYCSALTLVDENLNELGIYRTTATMSFENAFFNNRVTGCTCVINKSLVNVLNRFPNEQRILMHDWWLYIVGITFGEVVYDTRSYIMYRQHRENHVGLALGFTGFINRVRGFLDRPDVPSRITQAEEFLDLYGSEISESKLIFVNSFLSCTNSFRKRLIFVTNNRIERNTWIERIVFNAAFVCGRV